MEFLIEYFPGTQPEVLESIRENQLVKFILFKVSGDTCERILLLFRSRNHNTAASAYQTDSPGLEIEGAGSINIKVDGKRVTEWGSSTLRNDGKDDVPNDQDVKNKGLENIRMVTRLIKEGRFACDVALEA